MDYVLFVCNTALHTVERKMGTLKNYINCWWLLLVLSFEYFCFYQQKIVADFYGQNENPRKVGKIFHKSPIFFLQYCYPHYITILSIFLTKKVFLLIEKVKNRSSEASVIR